MHLVHINSGRHTYARTQKDKISKIIMYISKIIYILECRQGLIDNNKAILRPQEKV